MADMSVLKFDDLDMEAFNSIPSQEIEEPLKEEEKEIEIIDDKKAEEVIPEKVGDTSNEEENSSDDETSSQPSLYSSLAKVLAEDGVLPSITESDKIKTVEDLISALKQEIKNNEFADLTEEQKLYLEAIRTGVDPSQFQQQQSNYLQLKSITEEEIESNEELRKQLIYADFKLKGYDDAKASKLTQRSIDLGEDLQDAMEALEILKVQQEQEIKLRIEQEKEAKEKALKEQEQQIIKFKETLFNSKEIIPGVKVTPQIAEKVFNQAVKPVQLKDGRYVNEMTKARIENPIEFEAKLNYLFYITKGFSDFSKIAQTQKSKAVKELDDFVKGNTFAPKASDMGNNFDYTPKELKGAFDESIIKNIL
jgi:hypothetical protein